MGDKVDILIADKTDLGFKAIINDQHWGVLFESEVFGEMGIGKHCKGYIKQLREDGKIDVGLTKVGYAKVDDLAERILQSLKQNQGFLPLHDKSSPEMISKILKMSKANFKKSIGQLYRKKLILIEQDGIRIVE